MGVYKKENRWYIDYYKPDGKRKREVVTIPGVDPKNINRQDANKALSIRKAEIAEGKFEIAQTKKPVLFEKFTDRYYETYSKPNKKSYVRDKTSIKVLKRFFSGKTLQRINAWLVERYKSQRQKELTRYGRHPSKATINRELACLKHMFTKAVEWGLVSSNPVKKVKLFPEKPNKLRVLSNGEFEKLYNVSSDFLKPILVIAINTGLRRSEIFNLRWEDINFKEGFIYVSDSKNNDSRVVPINQTLRDTLVLLKNKSSGEYLFSYGDSGEPVKSIKKGFWAALRRSGIDHCRFHDLRHTFASRLVMSGVDIVTVKELMGHKDIKMTMRYSHPTPEHKKQAVERLNFETMDTYLDTSYNKSQTHSNVTNLNHSNVPVAQQDRAQDS